jgi:DNA-binding transcriptional LysR family regulator
VITQGHFCEVLKARLRMSGGWLAVSPLGPESGVSTVSTERTSTTDTGLGATTLATIMQMVASGYGVTLVPEVAVDAEVRDERIKLLRFAEPKPSRMSVSLGGRHRPGKRILSHLVGSS